MKDLIKFFTRNSFFFLFLLIEGISLSLLVQHNSFQKSHMVNSTRSITGFLFRNLKTYREYVQLRKINYNLLDENSRLRNDLAMLSPDSSFNNLYLIPVKDKKYEYHAARVVNNSVSKQYNYITLYAGRNHGLAEDMAVITEKGVVGIIIGVSDNYSVVIPMLNRNFKIGAKIIRNNYFGIAEWDGMSKRSIVLKEIPVHADVLLGDTIVTSGHSAIFPVGIPIGTISQIKDGDGNFYDIRVNLATDFSNLFYVAVIKNLHQEEQLTLEKSLGL